MAFTDFDSIFDHIGGFGRYQMMLFWINCLMNTFLVFVYFGQFFMTLTPPHWCAPPPDLAGLNLTSDQVKSLTIPRDPHTGKYLECVRYQVDFKEVVESNASWPDPSWPTTSCSHGWTYDYSLYYPTITSELDWVCAEDWKPTLAQSLFFVGSLVGSPLLGWAADAWGRLPVIVATNVVGGLAGVASAFCASFVSFTVFRFVVGMTYDTHYMVAYILLLEYVSSKYRTIMANVPIMIFLTAAMCALPWLAVALGQWRFFTFAIYLPQLSCVTFIWIVPESARWLLSQGRVEDAVAILKKAGRVNKKPLSDEVVEEFKAYGWKQAEKDEKKVNVTALLKTPVLRRRFLVLCLMWMVIILAYDAHMRNTEHIGPNVFATFTLAGFVELPADFLTMVAVEKLGRRHTTAWTLVLGGALCLGVAAVPPVQIRPLPPVHHPGRGDHRGRPRVRPPAGDAGPEAAGQPGGRGGLLRGPRLLLQPLRQTHRGRRNGPASTDAGRGEGGEIGTRREEGGDRERGGGGEGEGEEGRGGGAGSGGEDKDAVKEFS
ncbi:organic cation transporter protein isoform X6 [Penaeus vannamei]|uniref:organic cation transporter protein isoform X6 n=1 Tax=Penaeus vannamei TaxID=6689 RepID=UPI00387F5086